MSAVADVAERIARRRVAIALVGVALLLAGSWIAASAYHRPEETRTMQTQNVWTERASYTYEVPVTRNSSHYPAGTILPMGEPAYFRTISDSILVRFSWVPEAPDARGIAAATSVVQVRAIAQDGRSYWTIEHPLGQAMTSNAAEGLAVSGRVDLDALHNEVTALGQEQPIGDGIVNWSIRTTVVYAVQIGERAEDAQKEFILPIQAGDPRYLLPSAEQLRWSDEHSTQAVVVSSQPAGLAGVFSSLTGLALLVGGLVALLVAGLVPAAEPGAGYERDYRKYRDWVSVAGPIPDQALRGPMVEVGSLEDLVHVASEARSRVLLDATTREFYAILHGVTYRFGGHAHGEAPASG